MNVDARVSRIFATALGFARVETFAASSLDVDAGARRLEGSFYGSDGYRALRQMKQSGFGTCTLGGCATVLWFGPFSRTYVGDPEAGVPFFSSSEMLRAQPKPKHYISKALTKNLERLIVAKGTILVSCSGTIGNVAICTDELHDVAISQHAIRVIPNSNLDRGLLYAFLQSDVGQFLLTRNKSGSVVESLYEADVSGLPIPRLPTTLRREMTRLLNEACRLRVECNTVLRTVEQEIWRQNHLEPFGRDPAETRSFIGRSSWICDAQVEDGYRRLDATFYAPEARRAICRIKEARGHGTLADYGCAVTLLGKTFIPGVHKVERECGIPYFTGKDLLAARIVPTTFIASQNTAHLAKLTVHGGTVLVTCAGTVGRIAYVTEPLEGAAVTHDAIRIDAPHHIASGYLYACLSSYFAEVQVARYSYGSVISRLHSDHIKSLVIPVPSDGGQYIGRQVDGAFALRAEAQRVEDQVIGLFDTAIERGCEYVETKWGSEY